MKAFFALAAMVSTAQAYWLMGIKNFITTERIDPIVTPGKVAGHVHSVLGGSNFRFNTNTAALRQSECTSTPIPQDKSAYWFPHIFFQWNNGSFTSLDGGAVIYYLFSDKPGTTTAFPDDFRMISGDPTLRTYDPNSKAQKAVTFLCLDFNGKSTTYNEIPSVQCPSGVRAQINFPSCWDGKNTDSPDHKSHVAFLSGGPDSGTCSDPNYPITLPRIFMEVYWATGDWDKLRGQAKNPSQPFVYAMGDPTGYGYHADFMYGWDAGVLQKAVDNCHCNPYGDPTCCAQQGIFDLNTDGHCRITKSIDEQTTGTLAKLPGNNPVQPAGQAAIMMADPNAPGLISPVYAYTGDQPTKTGVVVTPGQTQPANNTPSSSAPSPSSSIATPPGSSAPAPSSSIAAPPSTSSPSSAATPSSSLAATSSSSSATTPSSSSVTAPSNAPSPSVVGSSSSVAAPQPSSTPTNSINPEPSSSSAGATTPAPSHTKPGQGPPSYPTGVPSVPHPSFPIPFPPAFPFPHAGSSSVPAAPKPSAPAGQPAQGNQSHGHHHHHGSGSGSGKTCSKKRNVKELELEARASGLKSHRRSRQRKAVVEA
ncbi:hypothetical protein CPB83DRAFT_847146 [Crepidotus variabilis]|uniref:DUF1996 domain-containing protein n=1 Tax=Crepidotus variabilis TaxID=179855 RepID=A0A9P6EPL7_9AGAR|nr:hypothetical protein CPB83DRAFT_847146 [Crepidotus variabilis]